MTNPSATLRIINIIEDTMVDGPGLRTSIYCAGCRHECPGCHNPQSWAFDAGHDMTVDEIMDIIVADPFADVTFSGGDPMYQPEGFLALAKTIKSTTKKTIWCYTGFRFEQLVKDPQRLNLLQYIDVVVDGPFVEALRDPDLPFRGSSNQRIIDVKKALASEDYLKSFETQSK